MTHPETRPSVGNDVGQDPQGDHPSAAPDNARSSSNLVSSDKYNTALKTRRSARSNP